MIPTQDEVNEYIDAKTSVRATAENARAILERLDDDIKRLKAAERALEEKVSVLTVVPFKSEYAVVIGPTRGNTVQVNDPATGRAAVTRQWQSSVQLSHVVHQLDELRVELDDDIEHAGDGEVAHA